MRNSNRSLCAASQTNTCESSYDIPHSHEDAAFLEVPCPLRPNLPVRPASPALRRIAPCSCLCKRSHRVKANLRGFKTHEKISRGSCGLAIPTAPPAAARRDLVADRRLIEPRVKCVNNARHARHGRCRSCCCSSHDVRSRNRQRCRYVPVSQVERGIESNVAQEITLRFQDYSLNQGACTGSAVAECKGHGARQAFQLRGWDLPNLLCGRARSHMGR